jgi:hypothetical protein
MQTRPGHKTSLSKVQLNGLTLASKKRVRGRPVIVTNEAEAARESWFFFFFFFFFFLFFFFHAARPLTLSPAGREAQFSTSKRKQKIFELQL